jgi:hypothetical protein
VDEAGQRAEGGQAVVHAEQVVLGEQQRSDLLLLGGLGQGLEGQFAGAEVGVHVHNRRQPLQPRRRPGRGPDNKQQGQTGAADHRSPFSSHSRW